MKNPFEFIKLANDLKGTQYHFLMIGRPPGGKFEEQFFRALEGSNVKYLGELSNEEVNKILCKARIFCCTSFGEGFPNTFLQAWMRKVPVVSLYVDPDDLIGRYRLGYHSKSYESLKMDTLNLITNPSILQNMAENVRKFAVNNFLLKNNIQGFHNYLTELNKI